MAEQDELDCSEEWEEEEEEEDSTEVEDSESDNDYVQPSVNEFRVQSIIKRRMNAEEGVMEYSVKW